MVFKIIKDDFEDNEEGIYDEEDREELIEGDEIDELEEGFMQGYEEEERVVKCPNCKRIIVEDFTEEEINGHTYRFCSERCATEYTKKLRH